MEYTTNQIIDKHNRECTVLEYALLLDCITKLSTQNQ